MSIAGWYKRKKHSRGFGIHSPSAYRMVREVLCPSHHYGYYAYALLRQLGRKRRSFAELCLIYRLLVDIQPARVGIAAASDIMATAKLALPGKDISGEVAGADFAIFDSADADTMGAKACRMVLLCGPATAKISAIEAEMQSGHIFSGPRHVLIDCRRPLPLEKFIIDY